MCGILYIAVDAHMRGKLEEDNLAELFLKRIYNVIIRLGRQAGQSSEQMASNIKYVYK